MRRKRLPTAVWLCAYWALLAAPMVAAAGEGKLRIDAQGQKLIVESGHFTAEFEGASLTSVVARRNDTQFCRKDDSIFPSELVYINGDTLKQDKHQPVVTKLLELAGTE